MESKPGGFRSPMRDPEAEIKASLQASLELKQALLNDVGFQKTLFNAATAMIRALSGGHKVIFFGNGGSAADAQHFAAELTGRYLLERPGLAAIALTANSSEVTAIGNDYGFERVFCRQLCALGADGDVAVAISTSGNSKNVIEATARAKAMSMVTVAMTGKAGGQLGPMVDHWLRMPSSETPRI